MNSNVKTFAVVGLGAIAKRHLKNLRVLHPKAKIYAVSSSGRKTDVPEFADSIIDINKLILCKPEYVILASPAPFHIVVAQILLEKNIPVLIEKPLSDNSQTCVAFQVFCQKKPDTQASVGYCLRFLPSAQVVKNALDQGILGTIYNVNAMVGQYLPSWRNDKDYKDSVSANKSLGGGALLELSHELDYLSWFLGELSVKHSCLRKTNELSLEVEEIANLVLFSADDVYVSVHLDFIQKSTQRYCEFIGQYGRLFWDLLTNTVNFYHASGSETLYAGPDYNKNNMYLDMLTSFEKQLQGQESSLATIVSATKVVQLIDDAKQLNKWTQQA